MKVRYIVSMSGKDATFPAFEVHKNGNFVYYDVEDLEGVNLIDAEMAVAQNESDYTKAKAQVEALKVKRQKEKDLSEIDNLKQRQELLKSELKELKQKEEPLVNELKDITDRIAQAEKVIK